MKKLATAMLMVGALAVAGVSFAAANGHYGPPSPLKANVGMGSLYAAYLVNETYHTFSGYATANGAESDSCFADFHGLAPVSQYPYNGYSFNDNPTPQCPAIIVYVHLRREDGQLLDVILNQPGTYPIYDDASQKSLMSFVTK